MGRWKEACGWEGHSLSGKQLPLFCLNACDMPIKLTCRYLCLVPYVTVAVSFGYGEKLFYN